MIEIKRKYLLTFGLVFFMVTKVRPLLLLATIHYVTVHIYDTTQTMIRSLITYYARTTLAVAVLVICISL